MRKLFLGLLVFSLFTAFGQVDTVKNSVLATGDWYKVRIYKNGVYKLDKAFLTSIGIDASSIDPQNLAVYSNIGEALPQANNFVRAHDLTELPLQFVGESDGLFDDDDYAIFYAQGPHQLEYSSGEFVQKRNIYADANYCYITIKDTKGKRIETTPALPKTKNKISTFNEVVWHEKDLNKIIMSGREWEGESFEKTKNLNFTLNTPAIIDSALFTFSGTHRSRGVITSFSLNANGRNIGSVSLPSTASGSYGTMGQVRALTTTLDRATSYNININHNNNGNSDAQAYVNFLRINYEAALRLFKSQVIFRNIKEPSYDSTTFEIAESDSRYRVWEINKLDSPSEIILSAENGKQFFTSANRTLNEYILFNPINSPLPDYVGRVVNQNLHGVLKIPSLLIVTHPSFVAQANELKNFKESYSKIPTLVVTTTQIYEEFSAGKQDISAIRDFVKMLYDRGTINQQLKSVLLFGDASYDYKNIIEYNTNKVPSYQARNSYDNINSYTSDDFYGFLEPHEGTWTENNAGNHTLDVGIGRFPVNTTEEAQNIVNKITRYVSNSTTLGLWRNKMCFVADDGDKGDYTLHMGHANGLAEDYVKSRLPSMNIKKLYLDNFEQVSGSAGQISPSASNELYSTLDNGVLIMNYSGHGGETGWTQEQIFAIGDIDKLKNSNNLPLFVTATCEFGRFDDPNRQSAAEKVLTTKDVGAIALVTTTRPVYASSNLKLSRAMYDSMFVKDSQGQYPTLGEIMRRTKNNSFSFTNNRNFSLLGDPSLTLAFPKQEIIIDSLINDDKKSDTISALSKVQLMGHINTLTNTIDHDFNGTVSLIIYDKEKKVTTLGDYQGVTYTYNDRNEILFNGSASVTDGYFKIELILPKDIAYNYGNGKISLYAHHSTDNKDAKGVVNDLVVGGSSKAFQKDDTPPIINLFMDDYSFTNGGQTNNNSLFIATLADDNGINLSTNGIGHETTLTIDGDDKSKITLNEYYTSKKDNYKEGVITYQLRNLSDGKHTALLKTWDTHNNSSTQSLTFYVGNEPTISFQPNPFKASTTLVIDHDRAGEDLDVKVEVLNSIGTRVYSQEHLVIGSSTQIKDLNWDGTNNFGQKSSNGIYFVSISLRYHSDNAEYNKVGRVVIVE